MLPRFCPKKKLFYHERNPATIYATGTPTFARSDAELMRVPLYDACRISDANRSDGVTQRASLRPCTKRPRYKMMGFDAKAIKIQPKNEIEIY